jgi:hypothetical protein
VQLATAEGRMNRGASTPWPVGIELGSEQRLRHHNQRHVIRMLSFGLLGSELSFVEVLAAAERTVVSTTALLND